jgi:hypothetical protein
MSFLKNIFKAKQTAIDTYEDFWNWFSKNEKAFHKVVKAAGNIEKEFFNELTPKLDELQEGIFFVTGMHDDNTVELILTAEGSIKNIVFVEEIVGAAPSLPGWMFTAHKPALNIEDVVINMAGHEFSRKNLHFYSNIKEAYPDEIDITVVHDDLTDENKSAIINGIYIFLDNYLGELAFAVTVDNLLFAAPQEAKQEPIPIEKLKDFLDWRQKEFIEKYEGDRHDTENDNYAVMEGKTTIGESIIATINTDLLNWDSKASHPWILVVEIPFDGRKNGGLPDESTSKLLDEIEDAVIEDLKDFDGFLNIGHQTTGNKREIYFACKDFRKPAKILSQLQQQYADKTTIDYDIYKDKYWQSFNRFIPAL